VRGKWSEELTKMIYADHRRFLPMDHPWRLDETRFGSKCILPPFLLNTAQTITAAGLEAEAAYASGIRRGSKHDPAKATGVTGIPATAALTSYDAADGVSLEPMHMLANVGKTMNAAYPTLVLIDNFQCITPGGGGGGGGGGGVKGVKNEVTK